MGVRETCQRLAMIRRHGSCRQAQELAIRARSGQYVRGQVKTLRLTSVRSKWRRTGKHGRVDSESNRAQTAARQHGGGWRTRGFDRSQAPSMDIESQEYPCVLRQTLSIRVSFVKLPVNTIYGDMTMHRHFS
jgi:hypothetical protein